MKNETRVLLQNALELMTGSVSSNEANSAFMSVQVQSVFPCFLEIEIRRPDNNQTLEVAIVGAGMRGARESMRFEDAAALVETVLSRLSFCFGSESFVSVRITRIAADPARYLPACHGDSKSGQLETMPEPVRLFVEKAVEQAVSALVLEGCQASEIEIQPREQGHYPLRIRLETGNDGAHTRSGNQLYIELPPSQFCLNPNAGEVVAFVMGRLPADAGGRNDHLEIELRKRNKTGVLPAIRLVFDEPDEISPKSAGQGDDATDRASSGT